MCVGSQTEVAKQWIPFRIGFLLWYKTYVAAHTHIQLKERFTKPKGVCTNAKIQDVNKNEDKSLLLLLLLLQDLKQSEPKVNPKIHFQCCCPERERKRMCAPARERVENQDLRELREEQLSNNSSIKCYIFEWNRNGCMIKLLFCKVKFVSCVWTVYCTQNTLLSVSYSKCVFVSGQIFVVHVLVFINIPTCQWSKHLFTKG